MRFVFSEEAQAKLRAMLTRDRDPADVELVIRKLEEIVAEHWHPATDPAPTPKAATKRGRRVRPWCAKLLPQVEQIAAWALFREESGDISRADARRESDATGAVSTDGRLITYSKTVNGRSGIFVRTLATGAERELVGGRN